VATEAVKLVYSPDVSGEVGKLQTTDQQAPEHQDRDQHQFMSLVHPAATTSYNTQSPVVTVLLEQ